jgi:hypothetical protein
MDRPTMSKSDIGRYLHVTPERARQIVNDRESFPAPIVTATRRRWDAAQVKEWADRRWWGRLPCKSVSEPGNGNYW